MGERLEVRTVRPHFEDAWRRRFVDRGGRFEDEAGIAGWSATGLDARFRRFAELFPGVARGAVWVDAGCGAGTYTRHIQEDGALAIGVDYSAPSLAKARNASSRPGLWVAADVKQLPLARGRAEGVLCFGVMQALAAPEPALRELTGLLRSGGVLWVDGLNRWCLPNLLTGLKRTLLRQPKHLRYDGPWALKRHLRAMGLGDISLYWLPLVPGRFRRLQAWLEHPVSRRLFHRIPLLGLLFSHSFILVARRPGANGSTDGEP